MCAYGNRCCPHFKVRELTEYIIERTGYPFSAYLIAIDENGYFVYNLQKNKRGGTG